MGALSGVVKLNTQPRACCANLSVDSLHEVMQPRKNEGSGMAPRRVILQRGPNVR
jgi:hypothetical protein